MDTPPPPPETDDQDCLTRADARLIVKETLIQLGVDLDNPIEFQADCLFVRKIRRVHESVGTKIINTFVGVVVTGGIAMVVLGAIEWMKAKGR